MTIIPTSAIPQTPGPLLSGLSLSLRKGTYDQIRFIDENGKDVIKQLEDQLEEKAQIVDYLSEEGYPVYVNATIKDVFLNLISNAIKYGTEGSKIKVDINEKKIIRLLYQSRILAKGLRTKIIRRFLSDFSVCMLGESKVRALGLLSPSV